MNAGLVLTGGGARAAYQVGVLLALAEIFPSEQSPFRTICGTSAGAINCVYLSAYANDWSRATSGLAALWGSLTPDQIYKTTGFSLGAIGARWITRALFGGMSPTLPSKGKEGVNFLLDTAPLHALLKREVDFEQISKNFERGVLNAVSFTATHYFAGTSVSFYDGVETLAPWVRSNRLGVRARIAVDHVMASSAIPVFFPPVHLEGGAYGDGCLRQTTPLSPAIHLGAEKIIAIGIRHERRTEDTVESSLVAAPPMPSLAQIGGELLNALFLDSLDSDIERMRQINGNLFGMPSELKEKYLSSFRHIPVLALKPSRNLGALVPDILRKFPFTLRYLLRGIGATKGSGSDLVSYLAFDPAYIGPVIDLGYEDTLRRRAEIVEFMEAPGVGPLI